MLHLLLLLQLLVLLQQLLLLQLLLHELLAEHLLLLLLKHLLLLQLEQPQRPPTCSLELLWRGPLDFGRVLLCSTSFAPSASAVVVSRLAWSLRHVLSIRPSSRLQLKLPADLGLVLPASKHGCV